MGLISNFVVFMS